MIVVLRPGTSQEEIAEVLRQLERRGIEGRVLQGGEKPLVHLVSGSTRRARKLLKLEQVEAIVPTSGPRLRHEGRRFYPYYFIHLAALCLALLAVLVLLAGHHPPGLGDAIDTQHPPAALSYPWFVRAPMAFVALFPESAAWLGWLCLYAIAAAVFFLPLLDRSSAPARARWPLALGVLLALAWAWLTFAGSIR